MIRVIVAGASDLPGTEGVLRPVNSALEGTTSPSRELEVRAGDAMAGRLAQVGDLPAGGAVITPGGDLPFPFVIHAVAQSPEEPATESLVRRALVNGLRRAREWGLESLTVLPFGLGPGSLGAEDAARVTAEVLHDELAAADTLGEIVIAVPSEYEAEVFRRQVSRVFDQGDADLAT